MTTKAMAALAALAVCGVCMGQDEEGSAGTAAVCMRGTTGGEARYARAAVSKMFAAIGVTIDWRVGLAECPAEAVTVTLSEEAPPQVSEKAMGYAMPYEGSHVVLLHRRILGGRDRIHGRALLAHVLAHEITHMLQGVARHSADGLMKLHWDKQDLKRMAGEPLPFSEEDIPLIRAGLKQRRAAARGPAQAAATRTGGGALK